jgi:hypothetical protein
MEFSEQIVAVGHMVGVADALGGTPLIGLALVLGCGALVALAGRHVAAWLVAAAAYAAVAVAGWLRTARATAPHALRVRRAARRPRAAHPAFLARCSGLRAPPPIA